MKISKNCKPVYYFSILLFLLSFHARSQSTEMALKSLKDSTNKFYGSSDLLNLGEFYVADHVYATGHPYFITDDYTLATVTIHNNTFEKIKARYNIESDQLPTKANADTGAHATIATKEERTHPPKTNDHYFVSINGLQPSTEVKGYCEEVYKGKQMFFIKYKKKFIDNYTDLSPAGFFSVVKTNKYIYNNKTFIPVNSRRQFLELFAVHKKDIKKFMRKNKIKYAHASSGQLAALMQYCDGL